MSVPPRLVHISRTYAFAAAHHLPQTPPAHKCHRLHGHNYEVDVVLRGYVSEHLGWLVDYEVIDAYWSAVGAPLDHTCLNEHEGLENPTAELLAIWLWRRFEATAIGQHLHAVTVRENARSSASFYGP